VRGEEKLTVAMQRTLVFPCIGAVSSMEKEATGQPKIELKNSTVKSLTLRGIITGPIHGIDNFYL
jgi:hypothetical protein